MRGANRLDNGINSFDTANVYSNGLSETILGKALKKYDVPREEVVIMTKVAFLDRNFSVLVAQGFGFVGFLSGRKDRIRGVHH